MIRPNTALAGLLLPSIALLLSGCPSVRRCPEGTSYEWIDGGGWSDECTTTPPYDASTDAAPSDGGPVDSGPVDAGGSDGGQDGGTDAGPPDAGPDAGPCGECAGQTPNCNPDDGECVGCVGSNQCIDSARPVCDTSPHECVQCVTSEHCNEAASSRCNTDTNMCTGCQADSDCDSLGGSQACDVSSGMCVECTAGCGAGSCTITGSCSAHDNDRITCESCDTDANCSRADDFCVPMTFGDPAVARGGYCLTQFVDSCTEPYTVALNGRTTLSRVESQSYCGINETLATCEAVRALITNQRCDDSLGDPPCPEGSICERVGTLLNRCTYACSGPTQCDIVPNPGSTCGDTAGTGSNYCGG